MMPSPAISSEQTDGLWKKGIQAGLPIAIGYMPIAFTFGLLAKTAGLSLFETVGMSIIVFAGASQYIALSMVAAATGAAELILTTFIMNIRHLLMSASLKERATEDPKWIKAIYAFFITDGNLFSSGYIARKKDNRKLFARSWSNRLQRLGRFFRCGVFNGLRTSKIPSSKHGDCSICHVYCIACTRS